MEQKILKSRQKIKLVAPLIELPEGEFRMLPISQIDPSPFNHRKSFPPKKMQELQESIRMYKIIENLTVRPGTEGRYELVTGERRFRAAKAVGLEEVPVWVKQLTDQQVREIQLTENLQREDPHPLEEADAIIQMQEIYPKVEEIAARLGVSKGFVYGRLKLADLIPHLRQVFLADKMSLKQAGDLAALSEESQQSFFGQFCKNWGKDNYQMPNLSQILDRFKCNLKNAPFSLDDAKLIPVVGACTSCKFNTAAASSLFPETEIKAVCTNQSCFQQKSKTSMINTIKQLWLEAPPAAVVFYDKPPFLVEIMQEIPGMTTLPNTMLGTSSASRLRACLLKRTIYWKKIARMRTWKTMKRKKSQKMMRSIRMTMSQMKRKTSMRTMRTNQTTTMKTNWTMMK